MNTLSEPGDRRVKSNEHFIALTCGALARGVYAAAATAQATVSVRLFEQGLHNSPKKLQAVLQSAIDAVEPGQCEAILLAYGLCGNSTAGLHTRHTSLVLARAHDCITLYLGSGLRYQEEVGSHPGTYWYSVDYMERADADAGISLGAAGIAEGEAQYEKYVEKYGREKADFLMAEMRRWTQHYTRAAFIDTGLVRNRRYEEMAQDKAAKEGWLYQRVQGNRRLVEMLVHGHWPEDEFLIVPPGHTIRPSYEDGIITAVEEEIGQDSQD